MLDRKPEWRRDASDPDYHDLWLDETIVGYVHKEGSRWFWSESGMDPRFFGREDTLAAAKTKVMEACRKRKLL